MRSPYQFQISVVFSLLEPTNGVRGKVIFAQACVIPSVHGREGVYPSMQGTGGSVGPRRCTRRTDTPWADTPLPRRQTPPKADTPAGRYPLGRHPQGRHSPRQTPRPLPWQTFPILRRHPTGMHSCSHIFSFEIKFEMFKLTLHFKFSF